jgi:hypothetical protein
MRELQGEVAGPRHLGAALRSTSELQASLRPPGIRRDHCRAPPPGAQSVFRPSGSRLIPNGRRFLWHPSLRARACGGDDAIVTVRRGSLTTISIRGT